MEWRGPENRMSGSGAGVGLEKIRWSGSGAVSRLNQPLTIRSID